MSAHRWALFAGAVATASGVMLLAFAARGLEGVAWLGGLITLGGLLLIGLTLFWSRRGSAGGEPGDLTGPLPGRWYPVALVLVPVVLTPAVWWLVRIAGR
jgi:hypothetical protein